MYNTIAYSNNNATHVLKDCEFGGTANTPESAIRGVKTLTKEPRRNVWSETNTYCSKRRYRKPPAAKVANADGDVLLTVLRDLHDTRGDIINGCTCKDTLSRVDTLIDNIENYMAEA